MFFQQTVLLIGLFAHLLCSAKVAEHWNRKRLVWELVTGVSRKALHNQFWQDRFVSWIPLVWNDNNCWHPQFFCGKVGTSHLCHEFFFEQKWSDWWFGTFFIFPYIGNNHPNWLIFFRGVGIPPTRLLRTKMVKNIIPRVRESHSVPGRPVSWNSFYGDVGSLSKLHQKSFFSGQSLCYIVEKTRFLPQSILYQIATVYILYSSIFRAFQLYLIDVFCRYQDKWWRQQPHREATRNDGQELGHHSGRTSQVAELWQFIQIYVYQWEFQDPKTEYYTIFLAIFCEDIPWNLGLIYGRYLQFRFLKWPLSICTEVYRSSIDIPAIVKTWLKMTQSHQSILMWIYNDLYTHGKESTTGIQCFDDSAHDMWWLTIVVVIVKTTIIVMLSHYTSIDVGKTMP